MKFTYNPADGDAEVTTIFGHTVEAGDSIEITDERQIEKLKNHPEFQSSKDRDAAATAAAKEDAKLTKAIDSRRKSADKARAEAAEATGTADAEERALRQAEAIAEARAAADAANTPNESQ